MEYCSHALLQKGLGCSSFTVNLVASSASANILVKSDVTLSISPSWEQWFSQCDFCATAAVGLWIRNTVDATIQKLLMVGHLNTVLRHSTLRWSLNTIRMT